MQEIVKIETETLNGVERRTVKARELFERLESTERFSKWFDRMLKYGFQENIDYTPYQMVHPQNGQAIKDYILTLDMAKELGMLSRNIKGREIRQYFINIEIKARELQAKLQPMLDQLTDYNKHLKSELAKKDRMLQQFEPTGFGDVSEKTGLPKTHKIKAHCRSSRKNYRLIAVNPRGEYVQLELPIFSSDQIAG